MEFVGNKTLKNKNFNIGFEKTSGTDASLFHFEFKSIFAFSRTIDEFVILNNKRQCCICYNSRLIPVFDIHTGELQGEIDCHGKWVYVLQPFSEHYLLSGSSDTDIVLSDCRSIKPISYFRSHKSRIFSLVQLDKNHFASSSRENCIYIWNLDGTYEPLKDVDDNNRLLTTSVYPEKLIAVSEGGNKIQLFNWKTSEEESRIKIEDEEIKKVKFTKNAECLVIISMKKKLKNIMGNEMEVDEFLIRTASIDGSILRYYPKKYHVISNINSTSSFKGIFGISSNLIILITDFYKDEESHLTIQNVSDGSVSLDISLKKITTRTTDIASIPKIKKLNISDVDMIEIMNNEYMLIINRRSKFYVIRVKYKSMDEMSKMDLKERIMYLTNERDDWFDFSIQKTNNEFRVNKILLML